MTTNEVVAHWNANEHRNQFIPKDISTFFCLFSNKCEHQCSTFFERNWERATKNCVWNNLKLSIHYGLTFFNINSFFHHSILTFFIQPYPVTCPSTGFPILWRIHRLDLRICTIWQLSFGCCCNRLNSNKFRINNQKMTFQNDIEMRQPMRMGWRVVTNVQESNEW